MTSEIAKRDQNNVPVLTGVTDDASQEIRMFRVNPATNRLLVSGTGGGGSPGGSNTQVQFNDSGSFGGDAGFTYNKTTDTVNVAGNVEAVGLIFSKSALVLEETGAGTDVIAIQAPNSIASGYTLTLPVDDGSAGQLLSTDGSGILSWVTSSAVPGGAEGSVQFNNAGAFTGVGNSFFFDPGNNLFGVSFVGNAPDALGFFDDVGGGSNVISRLCYVDGSANVWGVHSSGSIYTDGKIGIAQPNPTVKLEVIGGGSPVMGLPYESAAFFNSDNKVGIFTTQATLAGNGSSLVFGESVATNGSGYYPGFEIQNVNGPTTSDSYMRWNSLGRDVNGSVQAAVTNILFVRADGKVGVNINPSYEFDVSGYINTSMGYYANGNQGYTGSFTVLTSLPSTFATVTVIGGIITSVV